MVLLAVQIPSAIQLYVTFNRLFQVIDVHITSLFCSSKLIHRRQFITWFRNSLSADVNSNCVCCVSDQVQKKLESLQRCQSLEEVNYFQ